jgi:hypothetical protein
MKRQLLAFVAPLLMLALQCSMPSDPEETSWQAQVTVPIGVNEYTVGKQLQDAGFEGFEIEGVSDSADPDDTLALSVRDSVTMELDRKLLDLDSTSLEKTIGPITIQNSTLVDAPMNLPFSGQLSAGFSAPFSVTSAQTIKNVYYVLFDSTCPLLPVTVKNTCVGQTMNSLTVWIADNGVRVTEGVVTTLSPGQSVVVLMPIAGQSLDSSIVIGVAGTISSSGGTITTNEGIDVRFLLDNMLVSSAAVLDSLLLLTQTYEQVFSLSDSFTIDYVDFDTCIINYRISSTTPISLKVTGEMLDLWGVSFCKEKGIGERSLIAQNTTPSDSSDPVRYRGKILCDTLGKSGLLSQTDVFTFGPARFLASRDSLTGKSQGSFRFFPSVIASGKKVTLNKNDRFEADIRPVRFPFVTLKGTFQYAMSEMGDPAPFKTSFPWKKSICDSLRRKLEFVSAKAPLQISLNVSDSTKIDSALLHISIVDPSSPNAPAVTSTITLQDVSNQNIQTANIDLTNLLNGFPDSLIVSCDATIPAGANLFLSNERDLQTGAYRNNLKLGAKVNVSIRLPLDWKLKDTAKIVLEDSKFSIDSSLKDFDVMRDMEISLLLRIGNRTNFAGVLYAIAATDGSGAALLALREDQVGPEICNSNAGRDFINLLGNSGLTIPEHRTITTAAGSDSASYAENTIIMGPAMADRIIRAREMFIRWKLVLPQKENDALKNGDKVTIASSLLVKGTITAHTLIDASKDR